MNKDTKRFWIQVPNSAPSISPRPVRYPRSSRTKTQQTLAQLFPSPPPAPTEAMSSELVVCWIGGRGRVFRGTWALAPSSRSGDRKAYLRFGNRWESLLHLHQLPVSLHSAAPIHQEPSNSTPKASTLIFGNHRRIPCILCGDGRGRQRYGFQYEPVYRGNSGRDEKICTSRVMKNSAPRNGPPLSACGWKE